MKKIMRVGLPIIATGLLFGCKVSGELQADFISVQLIKVDTVYRHPYSEKLLTWQCENKLKLISFVPMGTEYAIGMEYRVLLTK